MPEFKESDSQPDTAHVYTPSTSASKNKGGRRRSGGFKSEAVSSTSKIGEVNPAEASKAGVQESCASRSDNTSDDQTSCSVKSSESPRSSCGSDNKQKSMNAKPQPGKATLDSIKKVEERIARRIAESEKPCSRRNGSDRNRFKEKERGSQIHKNRKTEVGSGMFAAIGRFFGSLFGSSSQAASTEDQSRPPRRRRPGGNDQSRSKGYKKGDSEKRHRDYRGGQKRRRKRASQNT